MEIIIDNFEVITEDFEIRVPKITIEGATEAFTTVFQKNLQRIEAPTNTINQVKEYLESMEGVEFLVDTLKESVMKSLKDVNINTGTENEG